MNSVASVFYYLRWIAPAFRRTPGPAITLRRGPQAVAYIAAAASLVLGVASGVALTVQT
ncbi:hypothetical protein GCM10010191_49390 [Actinomadura vinacea]|uniref:Uncharacterized protein n=1 Tax=Actinomadura vinacea TaxID=115336 RepID=A0ABP5WNP5_9ACTN